MTIRNRTLLVGLLVGTVLATAMPAQADPGDLGGASLTTLADTAEAALANLGQSGVDPNTTCQVTATGTALVQRTNALVGEVYGQDMGTAVGTCFSFDTSTYTATVTVTVEAFRVDPVYGLRWEPVCSATTTATSVNGTVQPLPPVAVCLYAGMDPNLNRYHRAHGVLTNSRGQVFESYSPLWYMTP